jgi:zinc protease
MTWQGPSVGKDPRSTYAADVLSYIFGQRNSAFYKAIVESGKAYSTNFSYNTLNHTGPIMLMAQTSADSFRVCREAILAELAKFTEPGYFSDEQLENAKTILAVDEQYSRERPSQYCHTVGYWWAIAGLDYYLNYIENLRKVTRKDIDTYIQTYVTGKPFVTGVLVSPTDRPKTGL